MGVRALVVAISLASAASGAPAHAAENEFLGLLRARDLTTFGFLRLDMRPAHAIHSPPGTWAIEAEFAHQNTWALSRGARDYLDSLPGRRTLGPDEVADLLALPGENYVFDMELATLDLTFHYKFTDHWGGYLVMSGVNYSGGFMDSAIESFHDAFGFDECEDAVHVDVRVGVQHELPAAEQGAQRGPLPARVDERPERERDELGRAGIVGAEERAQPLRGVVDDRPCDRLRSVDRRAARVPPAERGEEDVLLPPDDPLG